MKNFKKCQISHASSINDAIIIINKSKAQLALVTISGKLKGVVTDGDIRRAILAGISLDTVVTKIMQKKFK
jgi:CBS domain-containing protein